MVRYKATANIQWTFDTDDGADPKRSAFENLQAILGDKLGDFTFIHIGKIDQLKMRMNRMVLGEFVPDDVLPYIGSEQDRRKYIVGDDEYMVKMNSQRYFVFRASSKCVSCGLAGSKMLLEQHPNDTTPHFNMYGEEDGALVLMTKDHIQAKSTGGADRHSNYQTMCSICNQLKGNDPLTIAQTKSLREIYDKNHKQLTKKALHQLVVEKKVEMIGDSAFEAGEIEKICTSTSTVITKCDIHVYSKGEEYFGTAVYDKVAGSTHVASVKKGTALRPVERNEKQLRVPFSGTHFTIYHGLVESSAKECRTHSKVPEHSVTAQSD